MDESETIQNNAAVFGSTSIKAAKAWDRRRYVVIMFIIIVAVIE